MSTNEDANHSGRFSNFPGCNGHVNQAITRSQLTSTLFIYFVLYFIVTQMFHNF
jgi:hypothetical protein